MKTRQLLILLWRIDFPQHWKCVLSAHLQSHRLERKLTRYWALVKTWKKALGHINPNPSVRNSSFEFFQAENVNSPFIPHSKKIVRPMENVDYRVDLFLVGSFYASSFAAHGLCENAVDGVKVHPKKYCISLIESLATIIHPMTSRNPHHRLGYHIFLTFTHSTIFNLSSSVATTSFPPSN